jgi:hypothetical protein
MKKKRRFEPKKKRELTKYEKEKQNIFKQIKERKDQILGMIKNGGNNGNFGEKSQMKKLSRFKSVSRLKQSMSIQNMSRRKNFDFLKKISKGDLRGLSEAKKEQIESFFNHLDMVDQKYKKVTFFPYV